jgi:hypothetical protein
VTRPEPLMPLSSSESAQVRTSGGPNSSPLREVIMGDVLPAPGSLDVTVPTDRELGMTGFPRTPSLSADWGQVMRGAELAYSQVVFAHQSLLETLVAVGRDVLQLTRVSMKVVKKEPSLPDSFQLPPFWT